MIDPMSDAWTGHRDWAAAAHALCARLEAPPVAPKVADYLRARAGGRLLVACSGGADSICLLFVLLAHAESFAVELILGHYDHGWRGRESEADAAFVRRVGKQLDLAVETGRCPTDALATGETAARRQRLSFLRAAAVAHECAAIAYGHNSDDILETQLMRLARGAGTAGLAAPRPVSRFEQGPTHLRPLLGQGSEAIRAALRRCGIPWREDATNADRRIARNALRHGAIPQLRAAMTHDPVAGAHLSRQRLEEDAEGLDSLAKATFPEAFGGAARLERERLRASVTALSRRALTAWLARHEGSAGTHTGAIDRLLRAVSRPGFCGRISVGHGFVRVGRDTLEFQSVTERADPARDGYGVLYPGASLQLPSGGTLAMELRELSPEELEAILAGGIDPRREAYLSAGTEPSFVVRPWQPGDRYRPLGAPGTRKLKDSFIDRKIPPEERRRLPLVLDAEGLILWVPGFPPADARRLRSGTKRALRLTYHPSDSL